MTTDRLALIRRKNLAYHRWLRGVLECHKRRHRGPVPATWLARLAELESEYRQAVAALTHTEKKRR